MGRLVTLALACTGLLLASCAGPAEDSGPAYFEDRVAKSDQDVLADDGPLRFIVIGDRTGSHRPDIFGPAMERINLLRPEMVLSVGDFIEGYSEDLEQIASEWDEVEAMVARLDMPMFYVPGNHDLSNAAMVDAWNERRGATYYAFTYKQALFLVLDTEDPPILFTEEALARTHAMVEAMGSDPEATQARILASVAERGGGSPLQREQVGISAEQLDFVRRALDANQDVAWTFVFMHKPAWHSDSAEFAEIEDMLSTRDYTMIAGHRHYYTHERRNGRDYLDLATTGGLWVRDGPGRFDHVTMVTMGEDGPHIANLALSGISGVEGPQASEPAGE